MNARLSEGNVVRTAKRILGLAGLGSLALVCAEAAWAQSQPAQAPSPAARLVVTAPATSPGAGPAESARAAKTAGAQSSSVKPRAPRGQSEGIQVHGHWTIEVHDPDGKLVTHREFENALTTGNNNGTALLAAILGSTVTTGGWFVVLASDPAGDNAMFIAQPNSAGYAACPAILKNYSSEMAAAACTNTLSLTGAQFTLQPSPLLTGSTLTLMGNVTVPQGFPASIAAVATQLYVCAPSDSPAACLADPNSSNFAFTSRALDSQGTDPAPVNVTPGQMVQATVVLSFGTGN
jgi:hypothetical protein